MVSKSYLLKGIEDEVLDSNCEEALDILIKSLNKEGDLTFF